MKGNEEERLHNLDDAFNILHAALDNREQQLRER